MVLITFITYYALLPPFVWPTIMTDTLHMTIIFDILNEQIQFILVESYEGFNIVLHNSVQNARLKSLNLWIK